MGDHTTSDVLLYLMIIWIYTCQALVPKDLDVCFMQQDTNFTEVWEIIRFLVVLWLDTTHTQTHKHTHNTLRGQYTDTPI